MKGLNVLITAGPTHEAIDPVRFIGNHSTGKMGYAIAAAFQKAGASVTLITGPTSIATPTGVKRIDVTSSDEMYVACLKHIDQSNVYILSAAVADYKPAEVAPEKIKKTGETMELSLVKTIDIAKSLGKEKKNDQLAIGFALETTNEEAHAREKLEKKNFDFIVLNSLKNEGTCFGSENNQVTFISKKEEVSFELKPKAEVAEDILNYTLNLLKENAPV